MKKKEEIRRVWRYYHKILFEAHYGASWASIHRRLFPEHADEPEHSIVALRRFLLLGRALRAQDLGMDFGVSEPPPAPRLWPDEDPSMLAPQDARLMH